MSVKPRLVWSREYWDCGEVFSLCLSSQDWFDHMARALLLYLLTADSKFAKLYFPVDIARLVKTLLCSRYCKVRDCKVDICKVRD